MVNTGSVLQPSDPAFAHRANGGRDEAIQWLRALAALEVMVWHSDLVTKSFSSSSVQLSSYAFLGGIGVEIFFVVSGFLMGLVTSTNSCPRSFLVDRARRILPFYWSFTALVVVAFLVNPDWHLGQFELEFGALAKSFLILPQDGFPILMVGWTLEFEVVFYALVALFLLSTGGGGARIGATAFGVCLALAGLLGAIPWASGASAWLSHVFSPYLFAFGFGWMLYRVPLARPRERVLGVLGFAVPLLLAMAIAQGHELVLLQRICVAIAFVGAVLPLRRLIRAGGWASRAFSTVGEASYSIYLSHWFTLSILGKLLASCTLPETADPFVRLGGCLLAVCVGTALFLYVERPLDRTLRRSLSAIRKAPARADAPMVVRAVARRPPSI